MEQNGEPHESQTVLRARVAELIDFSVPSSAPDSEVLEERQRDGYNEQLVRYIPRDRKNIPALLLLPEGDGPFPAVVAYHQHHSQWHLGKSEVMGLAGDPHQAFGPTLAQRGVVVLAPDTAGFEDRRRLTAGTAPGDDDNKQYYNEMAYRLLDGELLMSTILADGAQLVSALGQVQRVDGKRIGVLGHSIGRQLSLVSRCIG